MEKELFLRFQYALYVILREKKQISEGVFRALTEPLFEKMQEREDADK